LFLGLLYIISGPLNLLVVFGCVLAARIISILFGLKAVISVVSWRQIVAPVDLKVIKKLWSLSWPMGLYLLIFSSYDRAVDSMMIERIVGLKEVAWYGLAYKVYSTLLQPAYFFVGSIFPILSIKNGPKEDKKKLYRLSFGLLMFGAIVTVITIYFLSPWIVRVLAGSEYEASASILRLLLGAVFFSYLGHLAGFGLISQGKQKTMLALGIVILVFNIGANLILIPYFGVYGAAGVTVATEALGSILMTVKLISTK